MNFEKQIQTFFCITTKSDKVRAIKVTQTTKETSNILQNEAEVKNYFIIETHYLVLTDFIRTQTQS